MESGNPTYPPTVHLGYLTDTTIVSYIERAYRSIRFVGPGLSLPAAQALVKAWHLLGATAVELVLEADSDLCRLGFCDASALELLQKTATKLGASVSRVGGLRLCALEIDGERIIFPPTPRLVENSSSSVLEVLLSPESDVSLAEQVLLAQGCSLETLSDGTVQRITESLALSPPQPFDLSRQVRVLSTRFQFVEFSLSHASLSRKRAKVPSDLLGLAPDMDSLSEDLLRASFQLISKEDEMSGEVLTAFRNKIENRYTLSLGGFGRVILHNNRAAFEEEIKSLKGMIATFQAESAAKLKEALDRNATTVVEQLLPIVLKRMPDRWIASLGSHPTQDAIRTRLRSEIEAAFGDTGQHLKKICLRMLYKDVTSSTLRDCAFRAAARAKGLDLDVLYEEYEAARSRE